MTTCGQCATVYGGTRTEHCTVCHQTFTSRNSGDRHRVGHHGVLAGDNRRRCLTVDEMTELGMRRNPLGRWMLKGPDAQSGQGKNRRTAPTPTNP
jgi:hypothetical protein